MHRQKKVAGKKVRRKKAVAAPGWLGAGEGSVPGSSWPTLGVRVDPELLEDVRDLGRRLSREQGSRVSLSSLLVEALGLLLKKYRG